MRGRLMMGLITMCPVLCGCVGFFQPAGRVGGQSSSSLVQFLYPDGRVPPPTGEIPELRLPLRVGLAFLPSREGWAGLDVAHKEQLLERIRQKFSRRRFIAEIVLIPDYYLEGRPMAGRPGMQGLQGVQRLYGVDLMALVSYDQVIHEDDNNWSLGYLTIVGAYVLKGTRHDVSTLVDLAVVDPDTHSLVLRAGGTDTRHGNSTLIQEGRESREAGVDGFTAATGEMIDHFDAALTQFETDVHAGKANVRVVNKTGAAHSTGGGGAFSWPWLMALIPLVLLRVGTARRSPVTGRAVIGSVL